MLHISDADEKTADGESADMMLESQLNVCLDAEVVNDIRWVDGVCVDCHSQIWTDKLLQATLSPNPVDLPSRHLVDDMCTISGHLQHICLLYTSDAADE